MHILLTPVLPPASPPCQLGGHQLLHSDITTCPDCEGQLHHQNGVYTMKIQFGK